MKPSKSKLYSFKGIGGTLGLKNSMNNDNKLYMMKKTKR